MSFSGPSGEPQPPDLQIQQIPFSEVAWAGTHTRMRLVG